ncbi:MAG: ribonuclease III [Magnetococcales bacterium]|nr:ribonuclease III [Magnetococcales bacterium]
MDLSPASDETVSEGRTDSPEEAGSSPGEDSLEALQKQLGYHFRSPEILCRALTHRSYLQDGPSSDSGADRLSIDCTGHNERLEFLGDAVLGLTISDLLFRRYPEQPEGALTHWRSSLVNTQSLARIALTHHLGRFLHMGRGELLSGGRGKRSLLGNAVEALLGAIYLDGGYRAAYEVIQHLFAGLLEECRPGQWEKDYKSMLQERLQGVGLPLPDYRVVSMEGAPHERIFQIACTVEQGGKEKAPISRIGFGRSKRTAQQAAAQALFTALYLDSSLTHPEPEQAGPSTCRTGEEPDNR